VSSVTEHAARIHRPMDEYDLVRHHYNRRSLWGNEAVLYRSHHPLAWQRVTGNYQNWEIDTSCLVPRDSESPYGDSTKLFYSDDVSVSLSRRTASMPYFFRNCSADELHVISRGDLTYETDFGEIEVRDRDVLVIPKGVTYRVTTRQQQETLRLIVESGPEMFLVPTEMVDHVYGKGRPPVDPAKVQRPRLSTAARPEGEYELRVKYTGGFSEFLGDMSTLVYNHHPLDVEIVDGHVGVFKFSVEDIERLGSTPIPFVGGAYLDNKQNLAWMLHLTAGGGTGRAPVHRNPDVDELRYCSSGPRTGNFLFSPQGVDHGYGRGYTRLERNLPIGPYDEGDILSAYTVRPLKGTPDAHRCARPCMA
jgi:homogentisate 1,2-dioxygenase